MALSNPVTVQVHGLAELERALMQLPEAVAGKALQSAVASGINVIKRGAVNYVPVGTRPHYIGRKAKGRIAQPGNLRKRLRTLRLRESKYSSAYALTFSKLGFYGVFHEFGTSKMKATPMLRPAFDAYKEAALEAFKAKLAASIELQRKKLYEESLRGSAK